MKKNGISIQTIADLTKLGSLYLHKVKKNLRNYSDAYVRFGLTGMGEYPNYQFTLPNGRVKTFNGRSHDGYSSIDKFEANNISAPFKLEQIEEALKICNKKNIC